MMELPFIYLLIVRDVTVTIPSHAFREFGDCITRLKMVFNKREAKDFGGR